jgi:hypothetical protein
VCSTVVHGTVWNSTICFSLAFVPLLTAAVRDCLGLKQHTIHSCTNCVGSGLLGVGAMAALSVSQAISGWTTFEGLELRMEFCHYNQLLHASQFSCLQKHISACALPSHLSSSLTSRAASPLTSLMHGSGMALIPFKHGRSLAAQSGAVQAAKARHASLQAWTALPDCQCSPCPRRGQGGQRHRNCACVHACAQICPAAACCP